MFHKKATEKEMTAALEKLKKEFGEINRLDGSPVREYMLKWLSAFAPDMTYSDAKAYCLPRLMYKNYLWNAFGFEKAECVMGEDAENAFGGGFEGECFVLLNDENLLCTVPDGTVFSPESTARFSNIIIFTKDFSKTYVNTGKEGFGPYYKDSEE